MSTLVTGAAGFIGSHLCERLVRDGATVIGLDDFNDYYDPRRKRANIAALERHDRFTMVEADVRDERAVEAVFSRHGPQTVAHLGAYGGVRYSIPRASLYTQVNIAGSVNLLDAARRHGVDAFVFASTSSVYGRTEKLPFVETDPCNEPLAPYPATKKAVEVLGHSTHHLHGMPFTALRFFSVYGPRGRPDMMPYIVTDSVFRGETITLFDDGNLERDWTFVDDVVSGIVAALQRPQGYQIINLGRGNPVRMSDFVRIVEQLQGRKAAIETQAAPASEPKVTWANIEKARRLLDYEPTTTIEKGLARLWDWYRAEVAEK
jgi:UDP-glucuronate 4-epimerase